MKVETISTNTETMQENIQDYVAKLQLYMELHSRNLVPSLKQIKDPRHQLLQKT